ncbi:hypothetical protein EDB80DRAFT_865761 [Ilyonectria destructans]|nr:hypothetical protein EDB80DRAFT_865761 [Ilyonectria destructans]
MEGFLVPDTYVVVAPNLNDLLIASIIWGFTLATGVFSGTKAFKQTWATWRRSRRLHAYAYMIWANGSSPWSLAFCPGSSFADSSSQAFGYTCILSAESVLRKGKIRQQSLSVCLWVVQIQCICGIIINRIALLMVNKRDAAKIRLVTAVILGLININRISTSGPPRWPPGWPWIFANIHAPSLIGPYNFRELQGPPAPSRASGAPGVPRSC